MIDVTEARLGQRLYRFDEARRVLDVGIVSSIQLGFGTLDPSPVTPLDTFRKPTDVKISFHGKSNEGLHSLFNDDLKERLKIFTPRYSLRLDNLLEKVGTSHIKQTLNIDSHTLRGKITALREETEFVEHNRVFATEDNPPDILTEEIARQLEYTGPQLGADAYTVVFGDLGRSNPVMIYETWVAEILIRFREGVPQIEWQCYSPDINQNGINFESLTECYLAIEKNLAEKGMTIKRSKIPIMSAKEKFSLHAASHKSIAKNYALFLRE